MVSVSEFLINVLENGEGVIDVTINKNVICLTININI